MDHNVDPVSNVPDNVKVSAFCLCPAGFALSGLSNLVLTLVLPLNCYFLMTFLKVEIANLKNKLSLGDNK